MVINLTLDDLRKNIDRIDEEILNSLAKRKKLIKEIATLKKSMKIPVLDKGREKLVLDNLKKKAKENKLDADLVASIYSLIFENSKIEQEIENSDKKCRIKEIGLIGFGRFGRLAAGYLSENFKVCVFNKDNYKSNLKNIIFSKLEDVCKKEVIMLAVPISDLNEILKKIRNLVKKDALIIDVCAVKEYPVKLMQKMLSKNTQILATHPLFGPDSASGSLVGRKIVLCRTRINDKLYNEVKSFLKGKGLVVIESTPKEHDEQIAKSLALTHFIGRALIEMKAANAAIDTQGYKNLIKIINTVQNDTIQLFQDMNHYNKYAKKVRDDFITSVNTVDKRIRK